MKFVYLILKYSWLSSQDECYIFAKGALLQDRGANPNGLEVGEFYPTRKELDRGIKNFFMYILSGSFPACCFYARTI